MEFHGAFDRQNCCSEFCNIWKIVGALHMQWQPKKQSQRQRSERSRLPLLPSPSPLTRTPSLPPPAPFRPLLPLPTSRPSAPSTVAARSALAGNTWILCVGSSTGAPSGAPLFPQNQNCYPFFHEWGSRSRRGFFPNQRKKLTLSKQLQLQQAKKPGPLRDAERRARLERKDGFVTGIDLFADEERVSWCCFFLPDEVEVERERARGLREVEL